MFRINLFVHFFSFFIFLFLFSRCFSEELPPHLAIKSDTILCQHSGDDGLGCPLYSNGKQQFSFYVVVSEERDDFPLPFLAAHLHFYMVYQGREYPLNIDQENPYGVMVSWDDFGYEYGGFEKKIKNHSVFLNLEHQQNSNWPPAQKAKMAYFYLSVNDEKFPVSLRNKGLVIFAKYINSEGDFKSTLEQKGYSLKLIIQDPKKITSHDVHIIQKIPEIQKGDMQRQTCIFTEAPGFDPVLHDYCWDLGTPENFFQTQNHSHSQARAYLQNLYDAQGHEVGRYTDDFFSFDFSLDENDAAHRTLNVDFLLSHKNPFHRVFYDTLPFENLPDGSRFQIPSQTVSFAAEFFEFRINDSRPQHICKTEKLCPPSLNPEFLKNKYRVSLSSLPVIPVYQNIGSKRADQGEEELSPFSFWNLCVQKKTPHFFRMFFNRDKCLRLLSVSEKDTAVLSPARYEWDLSGRDRYGNAARHIRYPMKLITTKRGHMVLVFN